MGQEFQVPAVFSNQQMSPAFQAALGGQDDNLADGIGQSYGVIGYKGKVWSLRYRGQRHNIVRSDDGTPSAHLDVIILSQAPVKSKSFYKKYEPGASDGERPICASMDGIVPDPDVIDKQWEVCATCPRNVFKTDPQTGRKGKECTDYKRLAVLILPTQTKPILGEPLIEPVFLRVPPASLNSVAIMGDTMQRQGFHYASYITRITFDPNKSWPEMLFRPLQKLTDGELPIILKLRQDPLSARITGGDLALPAPVQQPALPTGGVDTGLVSLSGQSPTEGHPARDQQAVAITTIPSQRTAGAQAATPTTVPSTSSAPEQVDSGLSSPVSSSSSATVDTGRGGAQSAAAPTNATLLSDTGQPEESDAELDARIAALISK